MAPTADWLEQRIRQRVRDSVAAKEALLDDGAAIAQIRSVAELLIETCGRQRRVFVAGNGGSASDAQHFATELVGRYQRERPGLFAVALTADSSALTAIANDYGYDQVFARQLAALAHQDDVFIGLSTSGSSANVLAALALAAHRQIRTVAITGAGGGACADAAELLIAVPHGLTPRIQECHILILHILCELIDEALFPDV